MLQPLDEQVSTLSRFLRARKMSPSAAADMLQSKPTLPTCRWRTHVHDLLDHAQMCTLHAKLDLSLSQHLLVLFAIY